MSKQLDPLRTTSPELHRFWFSVRTTEQWYGIMREARAWFGKNWRGMSKVRRKIDTTYKSPAPRSEPLLVWFDVPDPRFATWVSVKMSIQVHSDSKIQVAK